MATDPLATVKAEVGLRVAEIRDLGLRLSPLDLYARMNAIQRLAALHGLATLEELARCSAQFALLPGFRIAIESCLEHVEDAISSRNSSDCNAILAAVAIRLH